MATLELEPDFVKGLRLMFSTSRDAQDSLRAMLDEAIRTKYGTSKSLGTFQPTTKLKVCIIYYKKWVIRFQKRWHDHHVPVLSYRYVLYIKIKIDNAHALYAMPQT